MTPARDDNRCSRTRSRCYAPIGLWVRRMEGGEIRAGLSNGSSALPNPTWVSDMEHWIRNVHRVSTMPWRTRVWMLLYQPLAAA